MVYCHLPRLLVVIIEDFFVPNAEIHLENSVIIENTRDWEKCTIRYKMWFHDLGEYLQNKSN